MQAKHDDIFLILHLCFQIVKERKGLLKRKETGFFKLVSFLSRTITGEKTVT